jgi:ATP-dependent DNA helicase RecQ
VPEEQRGLWDLLRGKRRELAESQGVPPYVIFHDATLMQIMDRRPASLEAMAELDGVGEKKLARYGQDFLDVLDAFDAGQQGS